MNTLVKLAVSVCLLLTLAGCSGEDSDLGTKGSIQPAMATNANIVFLHHSTGGVIWNGGVTAWVSSNNTATGKSYQIEERAYPKSSPYGWQNYPYDYWNIWVNNAGSSPFEDEDTLEILTQNYDVIIWKHCYPVADVDPDGTPDITSDYKYATNYCLQYNALKEKMRQFPNVRFLVWTGAARIASATTEARAQRAKAFFDWVKNSWDEPGDNIFVWDFWQLETGGGLYLLDSYSANAAGSDSHPSSAFATLTAPKFCRRIVDVIEGRGDTGSLTGE